jgi:hypothetical protein
MGDSIMPSIIRATTSSGLQVAPDNSGSIQLQTNGSTTAVTIDTSQNVGIGTASPYSNTGYGCLTLNGSSGGQLAFYSGGALKSTIFGDAANLYLYNATSTGTVTISTNATERMRIDSSGNLLFNSGYGSVATAYGCRAWVNFNGTGTVAIRASGNVTSITDLGTGYYQINFTTAITDANYCVNVTGSVATSSSTPVPAVATNTAPATSNVRITFNIAGTGQVDQLYTSVAVFR